MISVIFTIISIIFIVLLLGDFRERYSREVSGDPGASGDPKDVSGDTRASRDPNMYDYPRENPNALLKGKNISGTVYSDYPMSIPGLGWIL
jgi:hypothetical protein